MQDPGNVPFMTASYGLVGPVRNAGGDPGNQPFDIDEGEVLRNRGVLPYNVPAESEKDAAGTKI